MFKIMTPLHCNTEGEKGQHQHLALTLYPEFTVRNNWQQDFQDFDESNNHQNEPEIMHLVTCNLPVRGLCMPCFLILHLSPEPGLGALPIGCVGKNGSTQWGRV